MCHGVDQIDQQFAQLTVITGYCAGRVQSPIFGQFEKTENAEKKPTQGPFPGSASHPRLDGLTTRFVEPLIYIR
jgi:hypothetical protein